MSQLHAEILAKQAAMHDHVVSLFSDLRVEKDCNAETVLWLHSPQEIVPTIQRSKTDGQLLMDRLSDLTAYDNLDQVDGPKRFVVVYQLYSTSLNLRLRIKLACGDGEEVPTITGQWKAANWLEREVFDMFGIRFEGHPDMRRILMDERFVGHPLRKEYELEDRQPFPDSLPVRIANSESSEGGSV